MTQPLQLIGRSSSHFTRVALIFAHQLEVPLELVQVQDLTSVDPTGYAGNPAMKIPTLRRGDSLLFGTENICRALAEMATVPRRIVWPDELRTDLARSAQELVWHGMAAQVQLIIGVLLEKLPADGVFFSKCRLGFESALRWLDDHLADVLATLPTPRDLSLFEVTLFCLMDHMVFRRTVPTAPYPNLLAFAASYASLPGAQHTPYRMPPPPTA